MNTEALTVTVDENLNPLPEDDETLELVLTLDCGTFTIGLI